MTDLAPAELRIYRFLFPEIQKQNDFISYLNNYLLLKRFKVAYRFKSYDEGVVPDCGQKIARLTLETPTSSQAIKLAKKLNESPVMKVELRDGTSQNFFVNKLFPRF
ncbi:unnamed protein product [Enterobius vermicularis]|uniref:L51_S25_CI-B8 domain-containing protein n=1 Tax=Enterobius vermicularis TaxID=51028 RepID=A0A0N4V660_ENTVE|nr:unnamed protein product [Enterobius vermicularis]